MRVLVLTESSVRSRYWEAALPGLRLRNIDAWFATVRAGGPIMGVLEEKGIPTIAFEAESSLGYPKLAFQLGGLLNAERFDIVHASESIQAAIAGLACMRARDTKSIFHYHHTHSTGTQKRFSRMGSRLCDMVMAVSGSSRNAAIKFDRTPREKTCVAYNGIEPLREVSETETGDLRRKHGVSEQAKVVVIVGGLRAIKGHRTLFEACRITAEKLPEPLHLFVVGDGEEMGALTRESSLYDTFKVHMVGHQDDVALWYSLADVVAMPSHFESFGLVAVEAMSCGKVVIASDIEGPSEIIEDEKSGILVPLKDAQSFADALLRVFNTPQLAHEIGVNARQRVLESFTMETMIDGWLDCYNAVLRSKRVEQI